MRIGIITTWFERGAAYVSRMYKKLLEQNNSVYIYARAGEHYAIDDPNWNTDKVTWAKKSKVPDHMGIDYDDFTKWIAINELDIVLFNEQRYWEPVLWCNHLNIISGSYVDYYTEDTIPLFENFDFLICNTKRHYSAFDWHQQAFYLPWGTDTRLFTPKSLDPVNDGYVTFFHSCGFSPTRKGTDLVLKAFSNLDGKAKLVIHSQVKLLERMPKLSNLISSLEKTGKLIIHTGSVTAPGLYSLGDVYVYPSRLDGIGLTMAEALSSGLPIIVSNCPPMNEFVDSSNGKVVDIDRLYARNDGYYWPQCAPNIKNLQLAMQSYINNYSDLNSCKRLARRYAEKQLDFMSRAKSLNGIFSSVRKVDAVQKSFVEEQAKRYELDKRGFDYSLFQKSIAKYRLYSFSHKVLKKLFSK